MTDEELTARLRDVHADGLGTENMCLEAADRIEQLKHRLFQCASDLQIYMGAFAVSEDKLATCEKHRDAYAECDRIGTQAMRDLEAKLAKAVDALADLILHTHNCEKELTEELHRVDFCGESLPLTNARETLAEIKGEIP